MKRAIVVFVVLGASVILPSPPSWACTCAPLTREELGRHADVVFTGLATDAGHEGPFTYWTSFKVGIVYKGRLGPTAAVETSGSGSSCGVGFLEGHVYTVFARAQEDGLDTNRCQGTAEGQIEPGRYGLALKPVMPGETRFAPQNEIPWTQWLVFVGGALVLYGLLFAIVERGRSRGPGSRR
jgi:hypothetical protein